MGVGGILWGRRPPKAGGGPVLRRAHPLFTLRKPWPQNSILIGHHAPKAHKRSTRILQLRPANPTNSTPFSEITYLYPHARASRAVLSLGPNPAP